MQMSYLQDYCFHLNSDDLQDPDLPLVKSKATGGTFALWRKWLDPFVTVYPVSSSSFLPLIIRLPNSRTSVHVALYLPTHGKDSEFVAELANLKACLDELFTLLHDPVIYIRGDGNVNPKNV